MNVKNLHCSDKEDMNSVTVSLRSEVRIPLSSLRFEDTPDDVHEEKGTEGSRPREEAIAPVVESEHKKKKRKKKDPLDIIFDILERTIEVLIKATPRLLNVIDQYLSAGGDPDDPKLRSLVRENVEVISYLDQKSRERLNA